MLVYHTVGHITSMADCAEATMTAEEIQIEETEREVVNVLMHLIMNSS